MKLASKLLASGAFAIAAPALLTASAFADPMSPADLATLERLGGVAVSPDDSTVIYSITRTDRATYARTTGLKIASLTKPDSAPVNLADWDDASEHSAAFAPDGNSIYFLSDKSGSEQLWRHADGQEPLQISNLALDIAGYSLSPDGRKIALWMDIAPGRMPHEAVAQEDPQHSARTYDRIFARHWGSWEAVNAYSRIFVYSLGADGKIDPASGKDIMQSLIGDSPTKPFGGGEEIAWSPDSTTIAFTLRVSDAKEPTSTNTDIYLASADGTGPVVNITANNQATDTLPAFSPDGTKIAYAAMARPGYESDRLVLTILDIAAQKRTALTRKWDRSVGSIAWDKDGGSLVVTAWDTLDHPAFRVDAQSGAVTRLTSQGNIGNVVPLANGGLVYTRNSLKAPNAVVSQNGAQARQISTANARLNGNIDEVTTQRFSFAGANGDTVWGQIIKPEGATGKLPLLFLVHGGPQGTFADSWSFRWNPKIMASQGYAVVTVDFHGSIGYGQAFTDSINQDWGGKPLVDLQLGLEAALQEDSQIDGTNACALGASYGGYMMNWIAGNWADRFKCLVNHAGLFEMRSFYYGTEELWFPRWDFQGSYAEQRDLYEKWNPANFVDKWQTPMLVIHGEKDFRVPYGQSIQVFNALQERDIPSRLVVFPDENHWINKGANSIKWHDEVFNWLDQWLKPDN